MRLKTNRTSLFRRNRNRHDNKEVETWKQKIYMANLVWPLTYDQCTKTTDVCLSPDIQLKCFGFHDIARNVCLLQVGGFRFLGILQFTPPIKMNSTISNGLFLKIAFYSYNLNSQITIRFNPHEPLVEQELLTLPEHLSSLFVFCGFVLLNLF